MGGFLTVFVSLFFRRLVDKKNATIIFVFSWFYNIHWQKVVVDTPLVYDMGTVTP